MAKVVFENVYKTYPGRRAEDGAVASDLSIPKIEGNQNHPKQKSSNHSVSVLRNIDFTVEDGEFMVLVGPSGCGKSTLLRMLAGLEELTGGNIYVGDRLINTLPPKARDIAMVFQNYALYPHLNVYDNIAFGLRRTVNQSVGDGAYKVEDAISESNSDILAVRLKQVQHTAPSVREQPLQGGSRLKSDWIENTLTGLTRSLPKGLRYLSTKEKEIAKRVKYVANLLQIESLLTRLPKELSGGQKQRVALGRAIARNPQVFLMDEPLSNLDAKLRTSTRAQIVQLQRQLGTTTIYVTHDQIEAMTMGDRIAVMNEGKIQQIAPPLEIYHHPVNRFVAEFIGSPPMNFISVTYVAPLTLIHSQFRLTLPETWIEPLQGYKEKQLLLGIRPEHFSLTTASEQNLAVVVNLVEALGNETYLSVHLAEEKNTTLQVKIPGDKVIARGESLHLAIDLNKIHLFLEDTGESVGLTRVGL